jgi:hypothetical protein
LLFGDIGVEGDWSRGICVSEGSRSLRSGDNGPTLNSRVTDPVVADPLLAAASAFSWSPEIN